jgi:glycogen phosphorylase/synthase
MVGIGLLYKFGYFRQHVNRNGEQVAVYEENNFGQMPVRLVNKSTGQRLKIAVEMPGRIVFAQVWVTAVGSVPLYLMDADVEENSQKDRYITSKLYDSSTRERIEQEFLLGIGGVTLLKAVAVEPSVFHLNEGHSAFLLLEQMKLLMKDANLDFETAREVVRSRSVFTTHTPVPAGNERHNKGLIENYFRAYVEQCGITWEQFWNLGHLYSGEDTDFEMTVFALKMCSRYNGVSRLHGEVARQMWQHVWRGFLPEEVPIDHVTNGVHFGSWISDDMRATLETYAGIDTEGALLDAKEWRRIDDIPSGVLWQTHNHLKNRLVDVVRQAVQAQWTREGEDPELLEQFQARINPAAFTIGFARRIATYKRPLLLLKNIERLRRLMRNDTYPVQIIIAGKAHPADKEAAGLIKEIVRVSKDKDFLGRLIFVEDYNIRLARALVSGVDLWLNNPVRPMEASGTSGMKAAFNGVINCSILDGWYDECYAGNNGWAIGDRTVYENRESQDLLDSESLYALLEEKIVPMFYSRTSRNVPEQWTTYMKNVMKSTLPAFNTHRMLRDYALQMYEPAAASGAGMVKGDFAKARTLADWKKKLPLRFGTLTLREVRIEGLDGNILNVKNRLRVTANVEPGKMRPSEILMEVVVQGAAGELSCKPMTLKKNHGAYLVYEGEFAPPATGQYKYGIRAIPVHQDTASKFDASLVSWG